MQLPFLRHDRIKISYLSRRIRTICITVFFLSLSVMFFSCTNAQNKFDDLMAKGKTQFNNAEHYLWKSGDSASVRDNGFKLAIAYLEDAVRLNPNRPEAHYYLGYSFDRLYSTESPGENIPKTKLEDVQKISAQFHQVIQLTPNYSGEIIAEGPQMKLTGIWGSLAMAYILKGQTDSAKSAFKLGKDAGGFTDAQLEFGRNLLASCEPDAILFVYLDHETFPAWYIQCMEKYRTDVTVCNSSILNTEWFIRACRDGITPSSNKIEFHLTDDEVHDLRPAEFSERKFELAVPANTLKKYSNDDIHPIKIQSINWIVKPTFTEAVGKGGLWINDRLTLDIIKLNQWKRPIYFSSQLPREQLLGLEEYLQDRGLMYELTPIREKDSTRRTDKQRISQLLFDTKTESRNEKALFSFEKLKEEHSVYDNEVTKLIIPEYIHTFSIYARALINEKKRDEAIRRLKRMEDAIPLKAAKLDPPVKDELIKLYSAIGEEARIKKVLQ